MISEVLFDPGLLAGLEDRKAIAEVKNCLFPKGATSSAVICKLGDEWQRKAVKAIWEIRDVELRGLVKDLFERIVDDALVVRDARQRWTNCEEWIEVAKESHTLCPFAAWVVDESRVERHPAMLDVDEFFGDVFWEKHANPRSVPRAIESQESLLRAVCAHSEWMIIQFPYIRGSDDETATIRQIIELANTAPDVFPETEIEIHLRLNDMTATERAVKNLTQGLSVPLIKKYRGKIGVLGLSNDGMLDREILAGSFEVDDQHRRVRKARWWIAAGHVAIQSRSEGSHQTQKTTWSLHSKKSAERRLRDLEVHLKNASASTNWIVPLQSG